MIKAEEEQPSAGFRGSDERSDEMDGQTSLRTVFRVLADHKVHGIKVRFEVGGRADLSTMRMPNCRDGSTFADAGLWPRQGVVRQQGPKPVGKSRSKQDKNVSHSITQPLFLTPWSRDGIV